MEKKIRVGVIGVGRGTSFMDGAPFAGMELVAICDKWKEKLQEINKAYGVATYTDYSEFLHHPMDAVVVANYFHEHAPFAIQALKAGKHVMSECTPAVTMAECVELARIVEKSGKIYMLAENYPYTAYNLEMAALYRKGAVGEVLYAEGEYNHPMSAEELLGMAPGWNHWRLWIPATYYCTHALAPLMAITGRMPRSVNSLGFSNPEFSRKNIRFSDPGAVTLVKTDSGAVFRLFALSTALMIFTKNEALVLHLPVLLALLIGLFALRLRQRRMAAGTAIRATGWLGGCFLILVLPWLIYKWGSGLTFGNAKSIEGVFAGWQPNVLETLWTNTFFEGNWHLLFPLLFALMLFQWKRILRMPLLILAGFLLVSLALQTGLFLFTTLSTEALMQTGFARGVLQLSPVAVFLLMLLLQHVGGDQQKNEVESKENEVVSGK